MPGDFSRLCALMRKGRADQIEDLYRDRIKAIKTFRQQNYDIQEDVISQVLMPEEFQNNFSAVKTKGDGNCLYNAAAIGIGGIFLSQHTLEMYAKSVLFEVIIPGDMSTIFQSIRTASSAGFNQ